MSYTGLQIALRISAFVRLSWTFTDDQDSWSSVNVTRCSLFYLQEMNDFTDNFLYLDHTCTVALVVKLLWHPFLKGINGSIYPPYFSKAPRKIEFE